MNLDEIWKVQAAPHVLIMGGQHLSEDYMWSISDQDYEIVNCIICKENILIQVNTQTHSNGRKQFCGRKLTLLPTKVNPPTHSVMVITT